mmetsp:Transcript_312/g.686  ORF Transcript_312/g.686 Transcript_312/m.686 type:complete len:295 (+) Transcript_312:163-1047(+)
MGHICDETAYPSRPRDDNQGTLRRIGHILAVLLPGSVHHIAPDRILLPTRNLCSLMQQIVIEQQNRSRLGCHVIIPRSGNESRRASLEFIVQIQLARDVRSLSLFLPRLGTACVPNVLMGREEISRLVAEKPHAFVQSHGGDGLRFVFPDGQPRSGHELLLQFGPAKRVQDALIDRIGQGCIVQDAAPAAADVFTEDLLSTGTGDQCVVESLVFGATDQCGALLGTENVVDDDNEARGSDDRKELFGEVVDDDFFFDLGLGGTLSEHGVGGNGCFGREDERHDCDGFIWVECYY